VAEGARTGLANVLTAGLFLAALLFAPTARSASSFMCSSRPAPAAAARSRGWCGCWPRCWWSRTRCCLVSAT